VTITTAFDSVSEQALDPDAISQQGGAACFYCGNGLPSQGWFDAMAARNVPLLAIQESWVTRAQEGYPAALEDTAFTKMRLGLRVISNLAGIAYAVSDGSRFDPNDNGAKIADYGQGVAVEESLPFTFYGNRYAVDSALGGALRVSGLHIISEHGGWLPETWDFDAMRDVMMQIVNTPSSLPGTDQNAVYVDFFTRGDDMLDPAVQAQLDRIEGALKAVNFGDNGGQPGSAQEQVGQLWAALVGADGDALAKHVQAALGGGGGSTPTGPTDAQVQALSLMKQALAAFTEAFPS
jgi:hypothetical protein